MIKDIIFDLGGVVMTIDEDEAKKRFKNLGLTNCDEYMNPYTQNGIFGDLEEGKITPQQFTDELGRIIGKKLSWDDVKSCWLGYRKEVPERNLRLLCDLRKKGYRIVLLSNTNAFMQEWAESGDFDGKGHGIQDYFDAMYRSYEVKMMKPDETFFRYVLSHEQMLPSEVLFIDDGPRNVAAASELGIQTFCPKNGEDWTGRIYDYLK